MKREKKEFVILFILPVLLIGMAAAVGANGGFDDWVNNKGGTSAIELADVLEITDAYLGLTDIGFVVTLANVHTTLDYYLMPDYLTPISPKYVPGDIIAESSTCYLSGLMTIISYDNVTDEYEVNFIYRDIVNDWWLFVDDNTYWYDREFVEQWYPTLIDHVDLSTVTIGTPEEEEDLEPCWHTVTSFNGSRGTTTSTFTIKGTQWRVNYTVIGTTYKSHWQGFYDAGFTGMGFTVFVLPDYVSTWDCDSDCAGTQHIYREEEDSSENYYFKVIAANLDSWTLKVEDYY